MALFKTALRVLDAWSTRQRPESADMAILLAAFPAFSQLPEDQLACHVIHSVRRIAFSPIEHDSRSVSISGNRVA
jgi:hypothetical protein